MGQDGTVIHATSGGRSAVRVPVKLCDPEPDEACVITTEPMGSASVDIAHIDAHAQTHVLGRACAELPCGHRFDARALVIHFMRNSMQCPLCRAGHGGRRMLASATPELRQEAWALDAQAKVQDALREDEREEMEDEENMLLAMPPLQRIPALEEADVFATVYGYANGAAASVQQPLELVYLPGQRPHYVMVPGNLRALERAMMQVEAETLSAEINMMHRVGRVMYTTGLGTTGRTAVSEGVVDDSLDLGGGSVADVRLVLGGVLGTSRFAFCPSEACVFEMVTMMG